MSPRKPKSPTRSSKIRKPVGRGPLPVPVELLTAGVELDPAEDAKRVLRLEGVKAALLQAFAQGGAAAEATIDHVVGAMLQLERENDRMAWRILRATRYRFGRRSEKLAPDELRQLLLSLGGEPQQADEGGQPDVPVPAEPEQVDSPKTEEQESESDSPGGQDCKEA